MTAVASPPSFQPLPRWNTGNGVQGALNTMSADEVSRMFMPRKSAQRTNSSSSIASSSSSSSSGLSTFTIPVAPSPMNGETPTANGDQGGWGQRKKTTAVKGLWPSSKAEAVSGLSVARPQSLSTPSSGQSAASTMSTMHQPSPVVPSTNRPQSQSQQNAGRIEATSNPSEPPAILSLLPMTGTFERKHINVPYFPEALKIGRQTNAKTVPTATNGYFDSKVLSRQHAEVWADRNGKIWIRDVKSSNGTFVNGVRLSPENRDSEPHELRENDTLELGIDIVSEDQKSIVHHKVSAKVEHAGIYGNVSNMLDLNFADIDVSSGNGLMGSTGGQHMSQLRGRAGMQGTIGINGRISNPKHIMGGNTNSVGVPRQMNHWMNPVTIEQVVKKLTTELRQAKLQSQELHRTGDFFHTLLTLGPNSEPLKPPSDVPAAADPQPRCISPSNQPPAGSPYSQPPAPPPQQPLPEKPDVTRFSLSDPIHQSSLRQSELARSRSALNSPTKLEAPSSQILSLVEALTTAKREIDSQSDRVKQLEQLLRRERKARETAEERARMMEIHLPPNEAVEEESIGEEGAASPPDLSEAITHPLIGGRDKTNNPRSRSNAAGSPTGGAEAFVKYPDDVHQNTESIDISTSRLQERLESMVREMDEMKMVMESYKQRAETAEHERTSLAELVEQIRVKESHKRTMLSGAPTPAESTDGSPSSKRPRTMLSKHDDSSEVDPFASPITAAIDTSSPLLQSPSTTLLPSSSSSASLSALERTNRSATNGPNDDLSVLQRTLSTALSQAHEHGQSQKWGVEGSGEMMMQSAPYVSMVGVVLIGVGLMTWLNGWQRGER